MADPEDDQDPDKQEDAAFPAPPPIPDDAPASSRSRQAETGEDPGSSKDPVRENQAGTNPTFEKREEAGPHRPGAAREGSEFEAAPILSSQDLKRLIFHFREARREANLPQTESELQQLNKLNRSQAEAKDLLQSDFGRQLTPPQLERRKLLDHLHLAENVVLQATWLGNRFEAKNSPRAKTYFADAEYAKQTFRAVHKQLAAHLQKEPIRPDRPRDLAEKLSPAINWDALSHDLRRQSADSSSSRLDPKDELANRLDKLNERQRSRYERELQNTIDRNGEASLDYRLAIAGALLKDFPAREENREINAHYRREEQRAAYRSVDAQQQKAARSAEERRASESPPREDAGKTETPRRPDRTAAGTSAKPQQSASRPPDREHHEGSKQAEPKNDKARIAVEKTNPSKSEQIKTATRNKDKSADPKSGRLNQDVFAEPPRGRPLDEMKPKNPPRDYAKLQDTQDRLAEPAKQVSREDAAAQPQQSSTPPVPEFLARGQLATMQEFFPEIRREAHLVPTLGELKATAELNHIQKDDRLKLAQQQGLAPNPQQLREREIQDHQHLAEQVGLQAAWITRSLDRRNSSDADHYRRDAVNAFSTARSLQDQRQTFRDVPDPIRQAEHIVRMDQQQKQVDAQAARRGEANLTSEQRANLSSEARQGFERKEKAAHREITGGRDQPAPRQGQGKTGPSRTGGRGR